MWMKGLEKINCASKELRKKKIIHRKNEEKRKALIERM
jgi:hypothetical protein